jgi:hypothetical protein
VCFPIQRFRLAVATLDPVENGQIVEADQGVRMAGAEHLAARLQCFRKERFGLAVAALGLVENGQAVGPRGEQYDTSPSGNWI